jgi:CheY-like chemotaxis protein
MSITKRLLDAMNGEIFVESTVDKGSVFTVRIPQGRIGLNVCGAELADKLRSNRFKSMLKMNKSQIVYEYMPYGSVLIVDDVDSNLYVAKGMMLPYGLKIETVLSGFEAIDKITGGNKYDIVFMDHMMPKLDGIETTKRLREMRYTAPIVALTANALSGSLEMFLANGFDGYMTKPIDIRELNAVLNRFIRDKQPPEVIEAVRLEMGSPTPELDKEPEHKVVDERLAEAVLWDVNNALPILEEIMGKIGGGDADIALYTTTVHGLKSALANIAETKLSDMAFNLEKAGSRGETDVILRDTPIFIDALKEITVKYKRDNTDIATEVSAENMALLLEKLTEIKAACGVFNKKAVKAALDDLKQKTWPRKVNDFLDELYVYLLRGEFKKVILAAETIVDV